MSGWAATTTGNLARDFPAIRSGEYGGPLVLFDENLENFILVSPLNNFMVSNWETGNQSFSLGLMGSIETVPMGAEIKTVLVWDSSLRNIEFCS